MARRDFHFLVALLAVVGTGQARASQQASLSAAGSPFFTITPCRLVDTRTANAPALTPGETRIFVAAGSCGIPSNALALAANLLVVAPSASGQASLFAGDADPPVVTTLAFPAGRTRADDAIVLLASDGSGTIALLNTSSGSANYVIDVVGYFACASAPATPSITLTPAEVCANSTGNQASGPAGATTYAWTISNGSITGGAASQTVTYTAGATGEVDLTLAVTNAQGCSASNTVKVPINPTPAFTPDAGALSAATFNVAYPLTFAGLGGTGPYTFALASGALPPGMTLTSSGLVLPNTPTATAPFTFTIKVTDASGCSSTQSYTLNVQPNLQTDAYSGVGNTQLYITGVAGAPTTPAVVSAASVLANDAPSGIVVTAGTSTCGGIGGTLTIDAAGRFLFTPAVNTTGLATCSYTGTSNGVSALGAINITLAGKVWYVNNSTGSDSSSRGRSQEPLATIGQAVTNASTNDSIFVHFTGTNYAGTSLSKDGLTLWGQGTTFALGNLTITGTSKPVINSTLTIGGSNQTISSLDVSTGSSTGITNTGTRTGLTIKNDVTLTTTTGTAVSFSNLDSTAGGAPSNGINFRSVSANGGANGGANGIVLTNVNTTTGSFSVLGDGANTAKGGNASGGTIEGMSGADGAIAGNGIYLSNVKNVSLQRMQLNDFSNSAIRGLGVTGFTLQYSTINGTSGDNSAATEGAVTFGTSNPSGANGLLGTDTIDNCLISGAIEHNMEFYNQSGSLTLSVTNSDIKSNSVASGGDGILMETEGTAAATLTVSHCAFDDNKSQSVQVQVNDSSSANVTIDSSTILRTNQGNEGFVMSNGENGSLTAHVTNNTISGIGGVGIFVGQTAGNASASSSLNAVISGNTITAPASATNSSIIAFLTSTVGQVATANVFLDSNTITQNSTSGVARGILVDTPDTSTTPGFSATITNNAVTIEDNVAGLQGVVAQARRGTGCLDIENNTVTFPNGTPPGIVGVRARQASPGTANLEQGVSGSSTASTVLAANNPSSTTEVIGTVTVVSNGTCLSPPP